MAAGAELTGGLRCWIAAPREQPLGLAHRTMTVASAACCEALTAPVAAQLLVAPGAKSLEAESRRFLLLRRLRSTVGRPAE